MTRLEERMRWCRQMARSATNSKEQAAYIAELCGLDGVGLGFLPEPECDAAYERGLRDRATLLNGPCTYILGPLEVTLLKLEE